MYLKKQMLVRRKPSVLGAVMEALGDYSDSDQCSTIPLGNPYRKPGNYCATPDGGMTTFNADGSTYRAPGAVDPDPAHPASDSSGFASILWSLLPKPAPAPTGPLMPPVRTGISTTTALLIGGGVIVAALALSRR